MRGQAGGPGERQRRVPPISHPPNSLTPYPRDSLLPSSFLPAFPNCSPCTPVSVSEAPPFRSLHHFSDSQKSPQAPGSFGIPTPTSSFLCVLGSPKSQTKFYLDPSRPLFASVSLHLCPTLSPKACALPRPSWSYSLPTCLTPQPRRIDLPGLPRCQPRAWRPRAWATRGEGSRRRRGGAPGPPLPERLACQSPAGLGADDSARRGSPRGAPLSPRGHGG